MVESWLAYVVLENVYVRGYEKADFSSSMYS